MPITKTYGVDPAPIGGIVHDTGLGERAIAEQDKFAEIDRFLAQLDEQERQHDQRLAYGAQVDSAQFANQAANRQQQLGLAAYEIQNRNQQQATEWDNRFALEQMDQQGQVAAAQGVASAQVAAQTRNKLMEQGFAEYESLMKAYRDGETFTSDEQFAQAKAAYDQRWGGLGMSVGSVEERLQRDASQDLVAQKLPALKQLFAFDGQPLADDQFLSQFIGPDGSIDWETAGKAQAAMMKAKAEERNWKKTQFDQTADERAEIEFVANQQRDDEARDRENAARQQRHEEKLRQDAELAAQNARITAQKSYIAAYSQWSKAKQTALLTPATEEGGKPAPFNLPEPKLEDFMPSGVSTAPAPAATPSASGVATPQSQAEYNALPSGSRYRHPDGTIKTKR